MPSRIILIGFMGTGKTAVGKRLATILKREFYDTDQEVEKVTGLSITRLFNQHGEIRFRSEEKLALGRLLQKENCVIATGGGIVLKEDNRQCLQKEGLLIALTARPEIICERVKKRNNRPLLKGGNLYEKIVQLMQERQALYGCADFYVDTSDLSFSEITDKIIAFLAKK